MLEHGTKPPDRSPGSLARRISQLVPEGVSSLLSSSRRTSRLSSQFAPAWNPDPQDSRQTV